MEFYSTEDVKCLKEILDTTLSDDVYCILLHAANQNDVSIVDESIVMSSKNKRLLAQPLKYFFYYFKCFFSFFHIQCDNFD